MLFDIFSYQYIFYLQVNPCLKLFLGFFTDLNNIEKIIKMFQLHIHLLQWRSQVECSPHNQLRHQPHQHLHWDWSLLHTEISQESSKSPNLHLLSLIVQLYVQSEGLSDNSLIIVVLGSDVAFSII